jgi:Protein of unknown function (DUF2911)
MKKWILPVSLPVIGAIALVCFLMVEPPTPVMAEKKDPMPEMPQQSKFPPLDKSSMDMCYYPYNFPILKIQNKANEPLAVRVIYSRPARNNRTIFGDLIEYGKLWRMGANEATEIELYKDAKMGGKKIAKGRYTLYAVPFETKWKIIVNRDTDTWGTFGYDARKDVLTFEVPVQKAPEVQENLAMFFEKTVTGANLNIAWDNTMVAVPFSF